MPAKTPGQCRTPENPGRRYFAYSTGPSTNSELERYLDEQASHHGYSQTPNDPVFVRTWPRPTADDPRFQTEHSASVSNLHLVFATWDRRGVFSSDAAAAVTDRWEVVTESAGATFLKVSFVADHVHSALRVRPTVVPGQLVLSMLNAAQEVLLEEFEDLLIRGGIRRLWKPGAYVGTFGELANAEIQAYMTRWAAGACSPLPGAIGP